MLRRATCTPRFSRSLTELVDKLERYQNIKENTQKHENIQLRDCKLLRGRRRLRRQSEQGFRRYLGGGLKPAVDALGSRRYFGGGLKPAATRHLLKLLNYRIHGGRKRFLGRRESVEIGGCKAGRGRRSHVRLIQVIYVAVCGHPELAREVHSVKKKNTAWTVDVVSVSANAALDYCLTI